nr:hypothetical protein [Tanacetum cinerariifolium]
MHTRFCSNLVGESSPNPTSSNPKHRNRRCSKQPFIFEESPVDTTTDQHTMAELLRAPTEGYAEAIVVPSILAEHFELKATNLRNEIFNIQQRFDESFHEAWDRYKDLLRACPHHGFTELHLLDTFYNALNPADQDSLNSAAGGNLLERRTQDVLTINKSKCLAADGNTFLEFQDNIQGYVSTAAVNYNHVVPLSELEKIKKINKINMKAMQTQINNVKNELSNEMKTSIQASMSNQTNELKNMMSSFFQMNTASTSSSGSLPSNTIPKPKGKLKSITTRSGLVLDGPSVPMPPPFINPEEDERVEETLTDQDLAEYTIKVPPPLVQKAKLILKEIMWCNKGILFTPISFILQGCTSKNSKTKMKYKFTTLLSNKEKLLKLANTPLNENYSAVILKKLPEKLGDLGKFLIPCGFSELKYKALADLANRVICTPTGIARDIFVPVGKFTFLADFVIVDYESDPRVPLILGRPFLRTARALIDVYGEEMILQSINMINIYDDSYEDYLKDLFATNHLSGNPTFSSHTDLTSPKVINPLSGNPTSSSPDYLLEEFADELALITFPPGNDDLPFDIESDLREIEYLLNHDLTKEMDYILEDLIDEGNIADPNDKLFVTILEMFTDEHTPDYSSPPLYDDFNDDLFKLEFDNDDIYDDPFDSKEDKIKESKLMIDELDPPRSSDFLHSPEYDSFLFEDFFEVDALPSTDNEDKVFNPVILIHESLPEVTIHVAPDKNVKKIAISHASLILEDFNPSLSDYELPFHKEVSGSEIILSFSSENEEKVFKHGILTSKGVHTSLLLEVSHRGPKALKAIKIFESPMGIFPCFYGEEIRILDVPCLHFYPP